MQVVDTDIAIVGAGGAGFRAAIAAAEAAPNLNVLMVSKVYPMRSHTVAAEGGAAGVIRPGTASTPISTTPCRAATGCAIRTRSNCSSTRRPRQLTQLEHWGCPWSRTAKAG